MEGWIRLYRQLLADGWFRNHKVLISWLYCLLKASYKPTEVTVGYQLVHLEPGQFVFGRKKASEETGLSEKEVRTSLSFLKNRQSLTIKTTNKYSIISIINWEIYQGNGEEKRPAKGPTNGQQRATYNNDKNEKKKRRSEISSEISSLALKLFPTGRELFDQVQEAISSTRRTGRISDSIILAQLKAWEKYPIDNIHKGIRIYLSKEYYREGKDEKYLLGIIRNQGEEAILQETKSRPTGSRLYDQALQDYRSGKLRPQEAIG